MLITAKPNGFTNQLMNNDPSSVEYHYQMELIHNFNNNIQQQVEEVRLSELTNRKRANLNNSYSIEQLSKRSTDLKTTDSNPTGSNLINQQTTDSNAPELKTTSSNDSTGSKTSVSSETETIATTISPIDLSSAGAVARRLRMNAVHVLQDMQQLS